MAFLMPIKVRVRVQQDLTDQEWAFNKRAKRFVEDLLKAPNTLSGWPAPSRTGRQPWPHPDTLPRWISGSWGP